MSVAGRRVVVGEMKVSAFARAEKARPETDQGVGRIRAARLSCVSPSRLELRHVCRVDVELFPLVTDLALFAFWFQKMPSGKDHCAQQERDYQGYVSYPELHPRFRVLACRWEKGPDLLVRWDQNRLKKHGTWGSMILSFR